MTSPLDRIDRVVNHLAPVSPSPTLSSSPSSSTYPNGMLHGQVAIVTGSGQGIGGATALLFASEGAKVVVTDIDAAKTLSMEKEINNRFGANTCIGVPGDVMDVLFPERIMKATIKAFGKLNILVNNAGYTWDGVIHKMTEKQWSAMLEVHCTAPFRLIKAAAPYMRDPARKEIEEHGKPIENRVIINISSTSGIHGNFGQINYSTAKMGVVGMTKTVAKEWGPFGIRCNSIAFGLIDTRLTRPKEDGQAILLGETKVNLGVPSKMRGRTDFIPLKRAGTAEEAAGGILMMVSPYSSYISGHCLEVTGGSGI